MPSSSLRAASILGMLVVLLACRAGEDGEAPARISDSQATARAPERRPSSPISVEAGGVWLSVQRARRSEVLRELARQAPFELVAGALPTDPLTLSVAGAPLEEVLAQLLEGVDYRVDYRFDPRAGAHVLARVVAGDRGRAFSAQLASPERRAQPASKTTPATDADGAGARNPLRESVSRWQAASDEDPAERRQHRDQRASAAARALELLDADAADLRVLAVEDLDIEGPGRERFYEMMAADPSPSVRAAAVRRLVEEESLQALESLYGALRDPASPVVLAAIQTLELVGDERALDHLAPLVDSHPDPAVRQAAHDAHEFLK